MNWDYFSDTSEFEKKMLEGIISTELITFDCEGYVPSRMSIKPSENNESWFWPGIYIYNLFQLFQR